MVSFFKKKEDPDDIARIINVINDGYGIDKIIKVLECKHEWDKYNYYAHSLHNVFGDKPLEEYISVYCTIPCKKCKSWKNVEVRRVDKEFMEANYITRCR